MPAHQHPAYREELEHLDYTLNYVEKSLETTVSKKRRVGQEVAQRDPRYLDRNSQEFIDLMVNSQILSGTDLKLRNLESARQKPYFARIDFHENGKPEKEQLYIGKMCLTRDEDQKLIIVDWRAPVANMYYESRLGDAGYECPDGEIKGNLSLKRQFSIDKGLLEEIFDIDITTNDQFLQSYLGASADNRLKDIVSTIQAEQNRVIRADMERPLIVQGVAGSGKTTIALHRIAFLIYNYGKSFVPENFMIIAPNRLFLNYISEVLPELGVERVKQTTFEDFAREVIAEKYQVKDPNEKLLRFVEQNPEERQIAENELIKQTAMVKSGLLFKDLLDYFLKLVEENLLPAGDLRFEDKVLFSNEEIRRLFFDDYRSWPIYKRVEQIQKHFQKRIKEWQGDAILQLDNQCHLAVDRLKMTREDTPERQVAIIALIDKKNEQVQRMKQFVTSGIKTYLKQIAFRNALECYWDFLANPRYFKAAAQGRLAPELIQWLRELTLTDLKKGQLELEDLAPVMYIKYRLEGLSERIKAKHVVIDEAQDFNTFQFYTLRQMIKDSSFTILGDLAQGIHSFRGTTDWEEVRREVFKGEADLQTLEQCYRTTVEIMETANLAISHWQAPHLTQAKPVIRHGEPVKIIAKKNLQEIVCEVATKIAELQSKGIKSIAIVGKTTAECRSIRDLLKKNSVEAVLISGRESEYQNGLVVVPSYLVKGLEFDAVFVANANKDTYQPIELDTKLLYVALTRPLHQLFIYYTGELTPLLQPGSQVNSYGF
jgi:DNA helicase-2/ATP-dependent DNA helicase PcrA